MTEFQAFLDDDTFLATQELDWPGITQATARGENQCPCDRCSRVRRILNARRPQTVFIDPADTTGDGVDSILELLRSAGLNAKLVMEGDYQNVTAPASFDDAHDLLDEAERRAARKAAPIASGVLAYFPDAIAAVAQTSVLGNKQHVPGQPLKWDRSKSLDEVDAMARHVLDYLKGEDYDTDGAPHLAKAAWRALALLQRFLDGENPGR